MGGTILAKNVGEMKRGIRSKEKELFEFREKIEKLERQIDHHRCRQEYDKRTRQIHIEMEVEENGEMELFLSYHVFCVNWRAAYGKTYEFLQSFCKMLSLLKIFCIFAFFKFLFIF